MEEELKFNEQGLIPAVLQDVNTGEVLMVAYMNRESLQKTRETGKACFWSRSRQELWLKGETSGNYQNVKEIRVDCDQDTLLVLVEPGGPACHTGKKTCFYRDIEGEEVEINGDKSFTAPRQVAGQEQVTDPEGDKDNIPDYSFLFSLYRLIQDRKENLPAGSYTTSLFKDGKEEIVKKVGEEGTEVVIAGMNEDRGEIIYETADFFYHLFVLLVYSGISIEDIVKELKERHGE
ncbi:MAG: bifunctional phosphoribosyl-AMP cyclohydrolase/phosphoribosyl-ATP diphosphatase HisIE [Halanaerobiales bacterium]